MYRRVCAAAGLPIVLTVALVVLAGCGRDEPTPTPAPPTATAVAAVAAEASQAISEAEASGAITAAMEVTSSVEVTTGGVTEAQASTIVTAAEGFVASMRPVYEIVGERGAGLATLAPDGSAIAFGLRTGRGRDSESNICIFTFADAGKVCHVVPAEYYNYPPKFIWSPDGAYIAFTEDPVTLGDESDLWVLTVADGSVANLTDDGLYGSYIDAEQGTFALDYLPMWGKHDGQIYFWRSIPAGESSMQVTLGLYRIAPTGGEPELVRDLTEYFYKQLLLYDNQSFFLDGVSDLSDDGTKVALLVRSFYDDMYSPANGLWVVDLTDPESVPQQLMTMDDFQTALPQSQYLPATPLGLSFANDGKGVVALAESPEDHAPMVLFYYADLEANTFTPLVDFSDVVDLEQLYNDVSADGLVLRYYSPWTGTVSHDGKSVLMFNDLGGVQGILVTPLPPDGSLPSVLYSSETSYTSTDALSSTSSDDKVLMFGLLISAEQ